MTGECCGAQGVVPPALWRPPRTDAKMSGPASRGLARIAASTLPMAVLVLLPKCPLCLAAWLTVATGIGFSASDAAWVRGTIVLLWVAVVAAMIWRRVFGAIIRSLPR